MFCNKLIFSDKSNSRIPVSECGYFQDLWIPSDLSLNPTPTVLMIVQILNDSLRDLMTFQFFGLIRPWISYRLMIS